MNIAVRTPVPPSGQGEPGSLLLDLPSRTLWGVVDVSVDPSGVVLLSDIEALAAQLDNATALANDYTDTQILTRAPVSHTHPSSQITDFNTAVQGVVSAMPGIGIPAGLIAMYSGSLANIGVGIWAGWHLCDGSPGTPDLRDKFIMGAGNVLPGVTNPAASLVTTDDGQHQHTAQTGLLTLALSQIPGHQHYSNVSGSAASAGAHTHDVSVRANNGNAPGAPGGVSIGDLNLTLYTGVANNYAQSDGAHTHSVTAAGYSDVQGGNGAHAHTIAADGQHHHTVTSAQLRNTLPYYALAYVIKL